MNTARSNGAQMGATYTAGISAGGIDPSNPTAVSRSLGMELHGLKLHDLNTARTGLKGFGTSTSAVSSWRRSSCYKSAETWDGTSWSEANSWTEVAATNRSANIRTIGFRW